MSGPGVGAAEALCRIDPSASGDVGAALDLVEAAMDEGGDRGMAAACACAQPLEALVLRPELSTEDYRRATLILGAVCRLGRDAIKLVRVYRLEYAPRSGFLAMNEKAVDDLTLDDAYDAVCALSSVPGYFHFGCTSIIERDGCAYESEADMMAEHLDALSSDRYKDIDAVTRLLQLVLTLLRERPDIRPQRHVEVWECSAWIAFCLYTIGRPAVGLALIADGILEFGVQELERWTPIERVTFDSWVPGAIPCAMKDACLFGMVAERPSRQPTILQQIIDAGVPQMIRSNLRAYEQLGKSAQKRGSVMANWYGTYWWLSELPLRSPEALPIVTLLRKEESAFRFALDHPLVQLQSMNMGVSTQGTIASANVFGYIDGDIEEDGESAFRFTKHETDLVISCCQERLCPETSTSWGNFWACNERSNRPMLSLCVSDANKQLLLTNQNFLPHLVSGLLFDATTAPVLLRADFEPIKASVQRDYAECLQQLSLFEPGRRAMLQDARVMEALRELTVNGWTAEAKLCAHGALLALLESQESEQTHQAVGGGSDNGVRSTLPGGASHIMMSYEWSSQDIVKKLVGELKRRRYRLWFDIEAMKGSTLEAMSEAIDKAEVMLYAVSLAYKESANCRLECSYAQQIQSVDLIPLMVQELYQPRGWLGLVMGARLWYGFFPSAVATEAAFMRQVDSVVRELGDRCNDAQHDDNDTRSGAASISSRSAVAEGVPQPHARVATPEPALAPADVPVSISPRNDGRQQGQQQQQQQQQHFSPSLESIAPSSPSRQHSQRMILSSSLQSPTVEEDGRGGLGLGTLQLIVEQQRLMLQREDQLRAEFCQQRKADKAEFAAQLAQQATLCSPDKAPATATTPTTQQIGALHARVEAMHASELLSEAEFTAVEDCLADFIEVQASFDFHLQYRLGAAPGPTATSELLRTSTLLGKAQRLLALSEGLASDHAFARQLCRKFAPATNML